MPDSAFLAITDTHTWRPGELEVLMVRRATETEQWYLPGGGFQHTNTDVAETLGFWLPQQLTPISYEGREWERWLLSPENGGHAVHLVKAEPYNTVITEIGIPDPANNTRTKEVCWWGWEELVSNYKVGCIPWAQFKMAMFAVDPEFGKRNGLEPFSDTQMKEWFWDSEHEAWYHPAHIHG